MNLKFMFNNGTANYDESMVVQQATPIELDVVDGGKSSRLMALAGYKMTLENLFQGIYNSAVPEINGVVIVKDWLGSLSRIENNTEWNFVVSKEAMILYDIHIKGIKEKLYASNNVEVRGTSVKPDWNMAVLKPEAGTLRDNLVSAIEIMNKVYTEAGDKYRCGWGLNGFIFYKTDFSTVSEIGVPKLTEISLDDIQEDDLFIFSKFMKVLATKGIHLGVFMLDCIGFQEAVLKGFVAVAKSFYGDSLSFFFNLNPTFNIPTVKFELPNYRI